MNHSRQPSGHPAASARQSPHRPSSADKSPTIRRMGLRPIRFVHGAAEKGDKSYHRPMTHSSGPEPDSSTTESGPSATKPAHRKAFEEEDALEEPLPPPPAAETTPTTGHPRQRWWKSARLPALLALAIAVIAAVLAAFAWFRPAHQNAQTFNDQQTAAAKSNICTSYAAVHQAVVTNTHLVNPDPNSPIGQLAVAANARLALLGGGAYLRDRLTAEPAAPADLTKSVQSMANTIEQLGVGYLAGLNSALGPLRNELDSEISQINGMCG